MPDPKLFYRRNLPHFQPRGATLFVTFRLHGSIPKQKLIEFEEEKQQIEHRLSRIADPDEQAEARYVAGKRHFGRFDQLLDSQLTDIRWLQNRQVANKVVESLHEREGVTYDLDAYTIMPNHGHVLLRPLQKPTDNYYALYKIMQSFKGFTAREANELLGRNGTFWQAENYDHVVRNEGEWRRIIEYILKNPVKAGLVDDWGDWPYSYCKYA